MCPRHQERIEHASHPERVQRLEAACQRALAYDSAKYRTVKTILDNGLDRTPVDERSFDRLTDAYTGRGRFSRDTSKLLTH